MHVSCEPSLNRLGLCPNCHASWDGGDIFDTLRGQVWCADKSDDDLRAHIFHNYGPPPYRWSRLLGIEAGYYDGVSYWMCPDCSARWSAGMKNKVIAG